MLSEKEINLKMTFFDFDHLYEIKIALNSNIELTNELERDRALRKTL